MSLGRAVHVRQKHQQDQQKTTNPDNLFLLEIKDFFSRIIICGTVSSL